MLVHAWRSLTLTRELSELIEALVARGVDALPYKGPALAVVAYGNPTLRQFVDLDILVPSAQLNEARATCLERGYRDAVVGVDPDARVSHYQHALVRARDGIQVELHWAFAPRYFRFPLAPASLAREPVALVGGIVNAIAPVDLLVVLSAHGARHAWSRLEWIADLSELLRARPDVAWSAALARADSLGARRMVLVGLALARDLLDAELPPRLAQALDGDASAVRLSRTLGSQLFRDDRASSPITTARLHLAMRERWRDRLAYAVLGPLTPSERDAPGLAGKLAPLRSLARPLRLARQCGLWRSRSPRPAPRGAPPA